MTKIKKIDTEYDADYFPLVGTSSLAMVGHEVNTYFQNGSWLDPIRKFISRDRILPANVRRMDLPDEALIVKANLGSRFTVGSAQRSWGTTKEDLPECCPLIAKVPRYLSLNFTGKGKSNTNTFGHSWTSWTPRLLCYLSFTTKYDCKDGPSLSQYSDFLGPRHNSTRHNRLEALPEFRPEDDEYTVVPHISFSQCPSLCMYDLDCMNTGLEYLYKLFSVGYGLQYDVYTTRKLEGGVREA
jgi:hypothetical protein